MFFSVGTQASAEEFVFASWGGTYQEAIRKAWLEPFAKETGIEILEDTQPETAKVKAMVDTNTVSWDMVTGGGGTLMRGVGHGLFEEIPASVDQSGVLPGARNKYGVPSEIFSTVFAFSTKAFPDGKPQPKNWADFWDVKKFPGKRSVYNRPVTILEAALLADGVAQADVYKELNTKAGQDRAFKKIEEIKPHVAVWWNSGAQPVQALGSGEVVMATGWNGRFQAGLDNNLPIKMVWGTSIAQVGYFMIVKGAPNQGPAVKFLNFILQPKVQAEFSKHVAYGPVTAKAWEYITDKKRLSELPSTPERMAEAVFMDIEFWADKQGALTERYKSILQQ
jgi:putative spermidine/putrescine transport system substrate-binding protein